MKSRELREKLTDEEIILIMEELGAEVFRQKENEIIFNSICHGSNSKKLYYYCNTFKFKCWSRDCKSSYGNAHTIITMIQDELEISYGEAIDWIIKFIGNLENRPRRERKKYEPIYQIKELPILDTEMLDICLCNKGILIKVWGFEGITQASTTKYKIGSRPFDGGTIVIPVFDINNQLVGIRQRYLDDYAISKFGKYRPVRGYEFPSSATLYGINISKDHIKETKNVTIFEGEKSCMKYDSIYKINNSVALLGSSISYQQIKLLEDLEVETITLALDKEGQPSDLSYRNKIDGIVSKLRNYFNVRLIWDTEGLLDFKDSPIDKGEQVFNSLVENAIEYKSYRNEISIYKEDIYTNLDSVTLSKKSKAEEKYPIERMEKYVQIGGSIKKKLLYKEFGVNGKGRTDSKNTILNILATKYNYENPKGSQYIKNISKKEEIEKYNANGLLGKEGNRTGTYDEYGLTNACARAILERLTKRELKIDEREIEVEYLTRNKIITSIIDERLLDEIYDVAYKNAGFGFERLVKENIIEVHSNRYMAMVSPVVKKGNGEEVIKINEAEKREVDEETYEIYKIIRNHIFKEMYCVEDDEEPEYETYGQFIRCATKEEKREFNIAVTRTLRRHQKDLDDSNIRDNESVISSWHEFKVTIIEDALKKNLNHVEDIEKFILTLLVLQTEGLRKRENKKTGQKKDQIIEKIELKDNSEEANYTLYCLLKDILKNEGGIIAFGRIIESLKKINVLSSFMKFCLDNFVDDIYKKEENLAKNKEIK